MTTIGKWYIAIYIGDDWDTIWKGKNYFTTIVNDAISFDTKQEAVSGNKRNRMHASS